MRDEIVAALKSLEVNIESLSDSDRGEEFQLWLVSLHQLRPVADFLKPIALHLGDHEIVQLLESLVGRIDAAAEYQEKLAEEASKEQREQEKLTGWHSSTSIGEAMTPRCTYKKINRLLESFGFQRRISKGWEATEAAAGIARRFMGGGRPYVQWRWAIIEKLVEAQKAAAQPTVPADVPASRGRG